MRSRVVAAVCDFSCRYFGAPDSLRGRLVGAGLASIAMGVSSQILALLTGVVLARLLGPEGYGQYGFAMAVAGILAVPIQLGLPQYLTRTCAVYVHRGQYALLKGLISQSGLAVLILGVAAVCLAGLLMPLARGVLATRGIAINVMWLGLVLVPILGLAAMRAGALRGLGKVVLATVSDELVRPIAFLLLVTVWTVFSDAAFGPFAAISAQVIASLVALGAGMWFLFRSFPAQSRHATAESQTRLWIRESRPFLLLAGAQVMMQHMDVLMLGALSSTADVGIYRVAAQAAGLLVFGLIVVDRVLAPHIAQRYEAKDTSSVQKMLTAGTRTAVLIALPIAGAYILFGRSILSALFGAQFSIGYMPLVALTLARLVDVSFGSVHTALNMTGHARDSARGLVLAAGINAVLNLLLIPPYGVLGAVMATGASLLSWNALLFWVLWRRTGLLAWVFGPSRVFG